MPTDGGRDIVTDPCDDIDSMGRPPIGKTAMTGAERTRQYRERLKAEQPPKQDGGGEIANPFFGPAKKTFEEAIKPYQRQIAELKRTVATLQRQLAEAQAKQPPKPDSGSVELQREVERLKAENASLRLLYRRPTEDELRRANDEIERLKAEVRYEQAAKNDARMRARELDAKLKVKEELPKDVTALRQQLTAAKTRILNLRVEVKVLAEGLNANPVTMTKAQHNTLAKVFHPDTGTHATKALLNEAMQVFNAIKWNVLKR